MSVSPARKIAFDVLRRVESESAYASDLLHTALDERVKPADAALATELTLGVLRRRGLLDFLLARHLQKPVERLDLAVALALRLGLYQLRFLEKIPARAAVHESVELVKQARKSSAAPLVNAVLRKAVGEARVPAADFLPAGLSAAERLATLHSHPLWLVERWLARLGEMPAVALLGANNEAPPLSCAASQPRDVAALRAELERAGLHTEAGRLLREAFSVSGGSAARTAAFREGRFSIQDEASQAVPLLLGVQGGERVLDLCAAPGGKTAALARAAGEDGSVVACDLHPHRLRATQEHLARLGLGCAGLVALDARQPLPFRAPFHRVLVDAPCSGTGTLARHPEIRWRLTAARLEEFRRLQVAILHNAIGQAAPGGRILYSTCSIEPEENEQVIAEICDGAPANGIRAARCPAAEMRAALAPRLAPGIDAGRLFDAAGAFRTLPGRDGTDGFFAALLERIQ